MRRELIAANWKMNLDRRTAASLAGEVVRAAAASGTKREALLAPPFPYLAKVAGVIAGSGLLLAGQDVSERAPGAFTGQVSAEMLLDSGCTHVIVGHSERRQWNGDTDDVVRAKGGRAADLGLGVILCVGEREEERERGMEKLVVERQLLEGFADFSHRDAEEKLVIAYEPVWAIGTGKTATPEDAEEMHRHVRSVAAGRFGEEIAKKIRVLYGGSVKPSNAKDLLSRKNIDGALVGGASLDGTSFAAIIAA